MALVVVSREHGGGVAANPEHLTLAERDNAAVEAAEGLGWLTTLEPRALVEFVFERHDVELTVVPSAATPDTFEDREAVWRDPALSRLGLAAGRDGYARLAPEVRDRSQAPRARSRLRWAVYRRLCSTEASSAMLVRRRFARFYLP